MADEQKEEASAASAAYSKEGMKLAVQEVCDSMRICIYNKLQYGCDRLYAALEDISRMTTSQTTCGRAVSGLKFDTMMTGADGEKYLSEYRSQMLKDFADIIKNCQ